MPGKQYSRNQAQGAGGASGIKKPTKEKPHVQRNSAGAEPAIPVESQYECGICGERFRILSLLFAHRRAHDEDSYKPVVRLESPMKPSNLCKYCDRKFTLERTLILHQLQHCDKINPTERRKLDQKELEHVEKPPLPKMLTTRSAAVQLLTGGASIQKQLEQMTKCAGDVGPPMGLAGKIKTTKGMNDVSRPKNNNLPYEGDKGFKFYSKRRTQWKL